jgi:glycerol-3-phosphate O-acyltransferase/dihydroxyacetone phosphate acyltransferase
MWLLPAFSRVADWAVRTFYRLEIAGAAVPADGPVLLVANHPNGLVDPLMVAAAARRPVRFLAKAPLFADRRLGWAVRAVGSIPVYRAKDDPAVIGRNVEMFAAVQTVLAGGAAVALFPEGISHDEPALAPLRTGAARIALGTAAAGTPPFPIIPIGLVLRTKQTFRSEALIVVGEPVFWSDLAGRAADDAEAARELTARIEEALRDVTLNLESWADAPVVECAEAIYAAEQGGVGEPAERLERLRVATETLAELRRHPDSRWTPLVRAVRHHARSLHRLGLHPADLHTDLRLHNALRWSIHRLASLPLMVIALAGITAWWVPYRLTGLVANALPGERDVRATYKLLGGFVIYLLWLIMTVAAMAAWVGPLAATVTALALPALGLAALWIRERWHDAWVDVHRWLLLRRRPHLRRELRRRQRELAERLDALLRTRS